MTLSLRLTVREPAGQFRLELIKAGVSNRCEIDLASGQAQLFHGRTPLGEAVPTEITRAGTYELVFANVDGRLTLWVDGRLPFGEGRTYDSAPRTAGTDRRRSRAGANRRARRSDRGRQAWS